MPRHSYKQLADFASLFKGKDTAYGVHIPNGQRDSKGKALGNSFTRTGNVTVNAYAEHLDGIQGLGVIPITDNDRCWFGAIDVDDYTGKAANLLAIITKSTLPLCVFRSKSGGIHLFLFFQEESPIVAVKLIALLSEIRDVLGLPAATEIFPKQKSVKGMVGNWINLPYFGESDRALLFGNGKLMDFSEALTYCSSRRTSAETVERILSEMEFSDGPPCLQSLFLQPSFTARNNYLFSAARYYKAKYGAEEFENYVLTLNSELPEPLEEKELQDTVLKSHKKKDYSYKCKESPLCEYCRKVKCRTHKFGVGNSEVSELNFGVFTQYLTDPPYYEWEVNGKRLKFYSESDLINQKYFQEQCVRHLCLKPSQLRLPAWDAILNTALQHVVVFGVDQGSELSVGATFRDHLVEFLTKRAMASTRQQVLIGRVFKDEELGSYVFQGSKFREYLHDLKKFTQMRMNEVTDRIKTLRGEQIHYFVDGGNKNVSVWAIPIRVLEQYVQGSDTRMDVNFLEHNESDF
jgi:hypothetical protein